MSELPDQEILLDVFAYTLADKLDIQPLVHIASQRFCDRLVQRPSQMTEGTQPWKTPAFADAIRELYLNGPDTDRKMHQAIVHVSAQYAKGLLTSSYGPEFRRVVDDVKTFGTEFHIAAVLLQQRYADCSPRFFCKDRARIVIVPPDQPPCPACGKTSMQEGYAGSHFRVNWDQTLAGSGCEAG